MLLLSLCMPVCSGAQIPTAELPNGLRIAIREKHSAPVVAVDLWVRAGSADERTGEYGAAHFLEHTLFKGTTNQAGSAADYAIELAGGQLNAATGADYAHYYTEVPAENLARALRVIADMIRNPAFPDVEVERERSVILDELAKRSTDPTARLTDRLYERAFPGAAYSRSPGGSPAAIKARGRDTLAAYCNRLYVPGNCVLSVAGDVTVAQVMTEATKAFGTWQAGPAAAPVQQPNVEKPIAPDPDVLQRITEQPTVSIAFPAPAASDTAGVCNALVGAALLGGDGLGGRLGTERWAGTHASVLYVPRKGVSLLVITAQLPRPVPPRPFEAPTEPNFRTTQELLVAIEAEVLALSTRVAGAREVAIAARTVQGEIEYDIETCAGMAQAVGRAEAIGQVAPEKMVEFAGKVGPAGLLTFAQQWLIKEREVRAYTNAEAKN